MKLTRYVLVLVALALLGGCATDNLKSPCVGAAGSPCERRPVGATKDLA